MSGVPVYTISVTEAVVGGISVFVGSVAEMPDIAEYAHSAEEARDLVKDTIKTYSRMIGESQ